MEQRRISSTEKSKCRDMKKKKKTHTKKPWPFLDLKYSCTIFYVTSVQYSESPSLGVMLHLQLL